jgi:hypothetical protein
MRTIFVRWRRGECDLDNLRTLCLCFHREVTSDLRRRLKGRT